jgi:microcystin-dependent protein
VGTTTQRQYRYAELSDAPPDVKVVSKNLADDLDATTNLYSGSLASRGAASAAAGHAQGSPGSFYYATDTNQLFLSLGGAWIEINMGPPVPLGGTIDYAGSGDPSDTRWLLADGRSLLRAGTYAALFGVIGTTYGSADGTHFNIPDLRGRVSVGTDNMGTAAGAAARIVTAAHGLGNSGGNESHVLVDANLPANKLWLYQNNTGGSMSLVNFTLGSGTHFVVETFWNHAPIAAFGNGNPISNLQPYLTMNKLVRVL